MNKGFIFKGVCPYCGGYLHIKGITPNGKKRWLCKDCKKSITLDADIEVKQEYLPNCPYCGSRPSKRGWLKDGSRRYLCPKCHKSFSYKTVIKEKPPTCTYCGSDNTTYKGKTPKDKQLYLCKDCGKRFVLNPDKMYKKHDILCPKCNTRGVKGDNPYTCLTCGAEFKIDCGEFTKENVIRLYELGVPQLHLAKMFNVTAGKIRWLLKDTKLTYKKDIKELMIKEILLGKNPSKVVKQYGYDRRALGDLNIYYEQEHLTPQQKNLIVKYGIGCNISAEDMAEYVKCSIHTCKLELERLRNEMLSVL